MNVRSAKDPSRARRIFVMDDHPMTRYGVIQLINDEPDLTVCGEAETADEAMAAIGKTRPDLILADITMPGKTGLDFIKDLQALHPHVATLVMSMHDETIYAERVLRAGARGYIMKSEGGTRLLEAVRQVLRGQVYLSPHASSLLLSDLARRRPHVGEARPGCLTDREFEIFQMIGEGLSTREISQRLHLSGKTVGVHRMHIKRKLQLRSGPCLVREAVRWAAAQHLV